MSETTTPLTLALSKGRIFEETMPCCEAGIEVPENPESSRKLILPTSDPGLRLIIVRAPTCPPTCSTARPTWASPARTC